MQNFLKIFYVPHAWVGQGPWVSFVRIVTQNLSCADGCNESSVLRGVRTMFVTQVTCFVTGLTNTCTRSVNSHKVNTVSFPYQA